VMPTASMTPLESETRNRMIMSNGALTAG
jgi:hypothetical protein